ncbi:MAG: tryptophan--tRNA ligase [Armatimonadetes bacterium]|nr:tryptophan--tRNA ligase [Armatimonadota bacterium]
MAERVLSGMRPTGRLHLGHFLGVIRNWIALQKEYDAFFMIADWHALTTGFKDPSSIPGDIREVLSDYIASGVDPGRCTLYVQSHVPEIAELTTLLAMITPVSWLELCPSYKGQIQELGGEIATYGFLGYPLLQTCDIIVVKAHIVPVGEDQLPHLELAREIVRRFHHTYKKEVFPEPRAKLTDFPNVPGTDGRKMSKSYGNTIDLADEPSVIAKKVNKMITDEKKIYKHDPGRPEICSVFSLQKYFNAPLVPTIDADCRSGKLGCVACKKMLSERIAAELAPIREKRAELLAHPETLNQIVAEGAEKSRGVARETLRDVKRAMKLC